MGTQNLKWISFKSQKSDFEQDWLHWLALNKHPISSFRSWLDCNWPLRVGICRINSERTVRNDLITSHIKIGWGHVSRLPPITRSVSLPPPHCYLPWHPWFCLPSVGSTPGPLLGQHSRTSLPHLLFFRSHSSFSPVLIPCLLEHALTQRLLKNPWGIGLLSVCGSEKSLLMSCVIDRLADHRSQGEEPSTGILWERVWGLQCGGVQGGQHLYQATELGPQKGVWRARVRASKLEPAWYTESRDKGED